MPSVALIGPDGAGKTTLTRRLEESGLLPFRYLYMGVDISASNIALPTSRLAEWIKGRSRERASTLDARFSEDGSKPTDRSEGGNVRAVARLTNRVIEEWYRQLISWYYQLRGYVVLYDRHFLFDFAPEIISAKPATLEQRLHSWLLNCLYPRPDLVIFLDAPGEVLFARKGESSVSELERRRVAFLQQGERIRNFVRVDATQPLEDVYAEVISHVLRLNHQHRPHPVQGRR
jgi:thymidylate kinase